MNKELFATLLFVTTVSGQIRSGFDGNSLAANDDGSTATAIPFGFTTNFFGNINTDAWLNNNGNITFNGPLATFSPSQTDFSSTPIIAPFFADVDTRGAGSNLLTYDQGTVFGRPAFVVNWVDVGYFASRDDLLNSFQLVLIDRSDVNPGDFDFEFNYGQIQWETGEASDGVNGLGGDSARVGFSNGIGALDEFDGSGINGALLDSGENALVDLTNVGIPGRFVTLVRNGEILEIVVITEETVATIRDGVHAFANLSTGDINRRLLRMRTGIESSSNFQEISGQSSDEEEFHTIDLEVFGSIDLHRFDFEARQLLNGGALVSNIPEAELDLAVATAGLELSLTNYFAVGGAVILNKGSFEHVDGTFSADTDSQGFAGYATLLFDDFLMESDFYVDVLYSRTRGDLETFRPVAGGDYLGGPVQNLEENRVGSSDISAEDFTLNAGLILQTGNVRHGPYGRYSMKESEVESFVESNSTDVIPSSKTESRQLELGYQISWKSELGLGVIRPHLRVGYEREFEDQEVTINTLSVGALPDSAVVIGAGLTYDGGYGMHFSADSEYRVIDSDTSSLSCFFGFGYEF